MLISTITIIRATLGESTNRKLMRDLRIYMAVGGMPQARGMGYLVYHQVQKHMLEDYFDNMVQNN